MHKITLYESNAVFKGRVVDLLAIDDRNDDLVVANDACRAAEPNVSV
jgi:hypothetical protein